MERLQHDLYFWTLVHTYVIEKKYEVLNKSEREVWLFDRRQKTILRLIRADLDWANIFRREVHEYIRRFGLVRKRLRLSKLVVENVYVTVYPPVDDWDDLKKPIGLNNKLTVYTSLIHRDNDEVVNEPNRNVELPLVEHGETVEEIERAITHKKASVIRFLQKQQEEETAMFSSGKATATYALIFSIALIFFQLERNGGSTSLLTLIEYGAKFNPLIIEGEWWRLFSAMFLHIGFLHLFMNSLALFYLGGAVERMFGTPRFLFIYFTAGFFGSLASFLFNDQIAAGASGAIFGCFGALLYFGTVHKNLFFRTIGKNVIFILILNIGFGLAVPMIDNGAHIGGLIGGFIAAQIVQLPKQKFSLKQIAVLIVASVVSISLFSHGVNTKDSELSARVSTQLAQEYIQLEDLESAYPLLEHANSLDPNIPEVTFMFGYIEGKNENYDEAKRFFERTVELRPEMHEAHYNLAVIYFELGQMDEGNVSLERALSYAPEMERYVRLKEKVQSKTSE